MIEKDLEQVVQKEEMRETTSDFLERWKKRHQEHLKQQEGLQPSPTPEKSFSPAPIVAKKKQKKLEVNIEQDLVQEQVGKEPLPIVAVWKFFSVILVGLLTSLVAIYFLSPLSKRKDIHIQGNQVVSNQEIMKYSHIRPEDYTVTTIVQQADHVKSIQMGSEWIKSAQIAYQFPFEFIITLEEYVALGYIKDEERYRPVLSSGIIGSQSLTEKELPDSPLLVELKDADLISTLFLQLAEVDADIVQNIQLITLTPSKATPDLLTLSMQGGHKVLVPLSEIKRKLPYYARIAQQLTLPNIIDMEVGIFSYVQEVV